MSQQAGKHTGSASARQPVLPRDVTQPTKSTQLKGPTEMERSSQVIHTAELGRSTLPIRPNQTRTPPEKGRSGQLQRTIEPSMSTSPKTPREEKIPTQAGRLNDNAESNQTNLLPMEVGGATENIEMLKKQLDHLYRNGIFQPPDPKTAWDFIGSQMKVDREIAIARKTPSTLLLSYAADKGYAEAVEHMLGNWWWVAKGSCITGDRYFILLKSRRFRMSAAAISELGDLVKTYGNRLKEDTRKFVADDQITAHLNEIASDLGIAINDDGKARVLAFGLSGADRKRVFILFGNYMAFKELRVSLRRKVYDTALKAISADMSRLDLKPAFNKIGNVTYESHACLHLEWNLFGFLEKEIKRETDMWSIITVTGDVRRAWATTCREYMEEIWPGTAHAVMRIVEEIIRLRPKNGYGSVGRGSVGGGNWHLVWNGKVPASPTSKADGPARKGLIQVNAPCCGGRCFPLIEVSGPHDFIINVTQQLAWLMAVFRRPLPDRLSHSDINIQQISRYEFNIEALELRPVGKCTGSCWTPLFPNCVLATDFPVPRRAWGLGLELPLAMMLHLAGVSFSMKYRNGIYLRGPSTLLFPTGAENEDVQWHLVVSESPNSPWALDGIICDQKWKEINEDGLLKAKRTFLGVYRKAAVHLGTKDCRFEEGKPGYADADCEKQLQACKLGALQAGTSGMGFASLQATLNFTQTNGLSVSPYQVQNSFARKLDTALIQPIILFDTQAKDRRGWLVSTVSVLLHMAHVWAVQKKPPVKLLFADAEPDGQAAYRAICEDRKVKLLPEDSTPAAGNSPNNAEGNTVEDLVSSFWVVLCQMGEVEARDRREKTGTVLPGKQRGPMLRGWDFMGIVEGMPVLERKQLECDANWLPLTKHVLVLFGEGFGDVIQPGPGVKVCQAWNRIAREKYYLTATTSCLHRISKRRRGNDVDHSYIQLTDTEYWDAEPDLFRDCEKCRGNANGICHKKPQKLRSKKPSGHNNIARLPPDGAVTFGGFSDKKPKPDSSRATARRPFASSPARPMEVELTVFRERDNRPCQIS